MRRLLVVALLWGSWSAPARADDFFQQSPGPLSSSHESLDGQDNCGECHTSGKDLSNAKCLGCHEHEDQKKKIDAGRGFHSSTKVAGRDCWTCHLEHKGKSFDLMGWAAVGGPKKFDHDLTDFKLTGKHAAVECAECHPRTNRQGLRLYLGEQKVCGACHKDDQPHGFERQEMMKCDRCHSDVAWKPPRKPLDFDHNDARQASFPLEGTHVDVACAKCHPKSEFNLKKDVSTCAACHENVHVGHLYGNMKCDWCHSPKFGSLAKFEFDHARRTKFKLDGKHRTTDCYSCHPKSQKKKPGATCEGCHARESKHEDRFKAFGSPPACGTCHPTSEWEPSAFQHDKKTRFALQGNHAQAGCRDCHRGKDPADWERFDAKKVGCMGCHKHTNVHKREFKDSECLGCHKTGGSMDAPVGAKDRFHGPESRFPLKYAHARVACEQCHKNDVYKDLSIECGAACHEDSLHRGTLGEICSRCHVGGIWEAKTFDHSDDSTYELKGLHKKASCDGCHPQRVYADTPTSCGDQACHLAEDAHNRKLGSKCEKCHRETGANVFEHNKMAAFKLDNAHLKVTCKTCHPSIEFKPRPKDCVGCHPDPDVHKNQFGTTCEGCHDTIDWRRIKPIHDVGSFSLTGSHDGIDCARCHKDSRPLAGTGNLCVTCHREDDLHANSLGPKCGECHTQWAFAPARFDHLTVGCDLRGVHRTLACFDCHKSGNFGALSPACSGCHRDDAMTAGNASGTDHTLLFDCGGCHNINFWDRANTAHGGTNSVCR